MLRNAFAFPILLLGAGFATFQPAAAQTPTYAGVLSLTSNTNQELIGFLNESSGRVRIDLAIDRNESSESESEILFRCAEMSPDRDKVLDGEVLNVILPLPFGNEPFNPEATECGMWMKFVTDRELEYSSSGPGMLTSRISGAFDLQASYSGGFGFLFILTEQ